MKKLLLFAILAIMCKTANAGYVFTSFRDGPFNDPATWNVEKISDDETNEYIINHRVTMGNYDRKAKSITINEGAALIKPEDVWSTYLNVSENFVNNGYFGYSQEEGLIDNTFENTYGYVTLTLGGKLENNGILRLSEMRFEGNRIKTTSPIQCANLVMEYAAPEVIVESDLLLHNTYINNNDGSVWNDETFRFLNMGNHALIVSSDAPEMYDEWDTGVLADLHIHFSDEAHIQLNNAKMRNCKISAPNIVFDTNSHGYFTETDSLVGNVVFNSGKYIIDAGHLFIEGNLHSKADINSSAIVYPNYRGDGEDFTYKPISARISVVGSIANEGSLGKVMDDGAGHHTIVDIITDGIDRTISGDFNVELDIRQARYGVKDHDEEVSVTKRGHVTVDKSLNVIDWGARVYTSLIIPEGATAYFSGPWIPLDLYDDDIADQNIGYRNGSVENNGTLSLLQEYEESGELGECWKTVHIDIPFAWRVKHDGELTHFLIEEHAEAPKNISNAINRWWKVTPIGENLGNVKGYVQLYYTNNMLNNQDANKLRIFQSKDGGDSWNLVSHDNNYERDLDKQYLMLKANDEGYTDGFGLFTLAKCEDETAISPVVAKTRGTSAIYDISGHKTTVPVKGIYIIDGKKLYVK